MYIILKLVPNLKKVSYTFCSLCGVTKITKYIEWEFVHLFCDVLQYPEKVPLFCRAQPASWAPRKTLFRRDDCLRVGQGLCQRGRSWSREFLHGALGLGLVPQQQTAVGKKAGVQDPENIASESCPGDQQQTLRSQTQQTLGLQIVLTTDGYTCLLSVWSLVTVLVKSQKMLPSASKHYYCFIWIKPRVSDFHADTGGHSGFTLE